MPKVFSQHEVTYSQVSEIRIWTSLRGVSFSLPQSAFLYKMQRCAFHLLKDASGHYDPISTGTYTTLVSGCSRKTFRVLETANAL